mgnify:CR=1 FL=1
MLVLFAVILGGIVTGRLLQSRRLAFVSRLIAVIIWALLFLLGLEVGSDPAVVGGMATLGRTAFVIFVFSVAGSIGASWLLWRRIRGRSAFGTEGAGANPASAGSVSGRELGTGGGGCGANCSSGTVADISSETLPNPAVRGVSCSPESSDSAVCRVSGSAEPSDSAVGRVSCSPEPSEPALFCAPCSPQSSSAACEPTPAPASPASEPEKPLSMWGALKGSLVIVAFFVAGCVAGLFALVPFDVAGARVSTYVLYALMFCVGVTLGHDETLAGRVRRLDPRLALLPVMTAVGTLAGAALDAASAAAGRDRYAGRRFGFRLLFAVEHLYRRFPGRGAGNRRSAMQCHARDLHAAGRSAGRPLVRTAGGRLDRRCDHLRHHAPRHHAGGRKTLCRGFDFPRLHARFQRSVSGDVFLYAVIVGRNKNPRRSREIRSNPVRVRTCGESDCGAAAESGSPCVR